MPVEGNTPTDKASNYLSLEAEDSRKASAVETNITFRADTTSVELIGDLLT